MMQTATDQTAELELSTIFNTEYSREAIGMSTYRFVHRMMRDPVCKEKIQKLARLLDEAEQRGG